MKFGLLPFDELDQVDFTLPPDPPQTSAFLAELKKQNPGAGKVYVGCAKWGRKEWVGQIYPEGTKDKDFLDEYVKNFNAIEMNTTFYSIKRSNVELWAEKAREYPDFRFSPKFSQLVSHRRRFKGVEEFTDYFVDAASAFGQNLGVSFLQTPDNFGPKKVDDLAKYLRYLPAGFPTTVELRHKDWFAEEAAKTETFDMLQSLGKGAVITDVAGRRDTLHMRITSPIVFIRFNGYGLHESDYTRMDEWAARIKRWLEGGVQEVYFFAHQGNETHTPITADYMVKKLNEVAGLNLKGPNFI